MLVAPDNLYFELRTSFGVARKLSDDETSPPERLLQTIWQHQRIRRDQIKGADGKPLTVLHPGFWSFEGGPDFRDALVQFGSDTPLRGDIEVDIRPSGWRAHNHHRNPAFENVILHVVWDAEQGAAGGPPFIALRPLLDSSIGELSQWLSGESARELPEEQRGKCCAPLRRMSPEQVLALLRQAAEVRFAAKAGWFHARARQAGWEQSLWEGMFRALGYKNNVWPMQRIAELRPRWAAAECSKIEIQSRIFGISGLLPTDWDGLSGAESFPRRLWDSWWRDRDALSDCILPREAWKLSGIRPANHPQRRLALGAHWCTSRDLASKLETWCGRALPRSALSDSLCEILAAPEHDFWSWHWTFRSARLSKPQPLLGSTRLTDLAINVVLPWLAARAAEGKNRKILKLIQSRYEDWPAAEDNSVLKLARQRLLGGDSRKIFNTAAAQQGLLQVVRDFCDHSNSICDRCLLPEMTNRWAGAGILVSQTKS